MKRFLSWTQWPQKCPTPLVIALTTCGKIGLLCPAPGTVGSAVGIGIFVLLYYSLGTSSLILYFLLWGLIVFIAIAFCGEAERLMTKKDPGAVILDEIVAIPFCFIGLDTFLHSNSAWAIFLGGFVLFRLFDILKPPPINHLQNLPGGWGIVADDLAAALLTSVVLNIISRAFIIIF